MNKTVRAIQERALAAGGPGSGRHKSQEDIQTETLGGMHMREDWVPADNLRGVKVAHSGFQKSLDDVVEKAGPGGKVRARVDKASDRFIYEHKRAGED
jgi:hypothetical protein